VRSEDDLAGAARALARARELKTVSYRRDRLAENG